MTPPVRPVALLDILLDRALIWARGVRRDSWIALLALTLAALMRVAAMGILTDTFDEGSYVETLRVWVHGAPLYGAISLGQPPFFMLSLLPTFVLGGQTLASARLGIVIFSMLGIGAVWAIGRMLDGPRTALIASLLLAFDPQYFTQSWTVDAEVPALALTLVALALALGYRHAPRRRWAALAGVALAAAILTKLAALLAVPALIAAILPPTWFTLARQSWAARRWPDRARWAELWRTARPGLRPLGTGWLVMTTLILLPFAGNLANLWHQVVAIRHIAEGLPGITSTAHLGVLLGAWWEAPLIAVATISVIANIRRERWVVAIFGLWGALTLVALILQRPLFTHHLALLTPPCVLCAALLPSDLATTALPSLRGQLAGLLLAGVVVVGALTIVAQQNELRAHPPLTTLLAALDLENVTEPGTLVITDDPMVAVLADQDVPPNLADTSYVRIAAGQLTAADVERAAMDPRVTAVLWISGRFERLPGLKVWLNQHFVRVYDYGNGNGLYVRGGPSLPVGLGGAWTHG